MIDVTVVVATCGTNWWRQAGDEAARTVPLGIPVVRVHEPDGTVAGTRNTGLTQTTTEYVCWLDADDSLTPSYFDNITTNADIIQPNVPRWGGPQCRHHGPAHRARRDCLAYGNPFSPGAIVRTALAKAHPWDERWPVLENFAFWRTICADPTVTVECVDAIYRARTRRNPSPRNRSLPRDQWEAIAHDIANTISFPG